MQIEKNIIIIIIMLINIMVNKLPRALIETSEPKKG